MLSFRLETVEEAKVILAFHFVGTVDGSVQDCAGSWIYPEDRLLRIGGVPLFSGFMYAAVGSYLARVRRIFELRFEPYPRCCGRSCWRVAVYVNFFAHHWLPDVADRAVRRRCLRCSGARGRVSPVWREERWMPLLVGWLLVALFIWFAENLGTFARAWAYPSQRSRLDEWSRRPSSGAWYLLMYISFVLVAAVRPLASARRMETLMVHTGGCLCGQVRFTIDAEPQGARMCWCRDCQRIASGSATVNVLFPEQAVRYEGEMTTLRLIADSGNTVERGFCPQCGAQMYSKTVEPAGPADAGARRHARRSRADGADRDHLGRERAELGAARSRAAAPPEEGHRRSGPAKARRKSRSRPSAGR